MSQPSTNPGGPPPTKTLATIPPHPRPRWQYQWPWNTGTYSLVDKSLLNFRHPVPRAMRRRGSSDGWLSLIGFDLTITLFNPFSKKHIPLSPMNTIPNPFDDMLCWLLLIRKVVLSSDPSFAPNFLVVITYSCQAKLAFFRPGMESY
ncbi:SWR1-complex protein 3 [Asimina triloba]